ncbi:MAG: methylated-DNA--[protein]-cysteine S-methyltransferase [Alphaproteobacteria bacterium]|nr:methylated-DNA--[protein]-cysteine S-methyltransferase [Alphaproteobacteria bacterium]
MKPRAALLRTRIDSPIGPLTLIADAAGLAGVYFEGHSKGGPPAHARDGESAVFDTARRQLDAYFAGRRTTFDIPLAPHGTAFQSHVWGLLQRVPFGATTTYGALAEEMGRPSAVRAVAGAVARNPVSIVIPCHRVIGADGRLTGFAGGLERKERLLALEQGGALAL